MPDPVHCDDRMELARLIPKFEALPELLVLKCERCGHNSPRDANPHLFSDLM
jgi:hypothetical protein